MGQLTKSTDNTASHTTDGSKHATCSHPTCPFPLRVSVSIGESHHIGDVEDQGQKDNWQERDVARYSCMRSASTWHLAGTTEKLTISGLPQIARLSKLRDMRKAPSRTSWNRRHSLVGMAVQAKNN